MTLYQTKEDVSELSITDAEAALAQLGQTYDLESSIAASTPTEWVEYDQVANNLLWLEDHISYSKQVEHLNSIRHKEAV